MASFTLLVGAAPEQTNDHYAAWAFSQAVLFAGHELHLFFHQDAVRAADRRYDIPSDEWQVGQQWQTLLTEQGLQAVVCSAAAQRRGLLSTGNDDSTAAPLRSGFVIGGLGMLVEYTSVTDRLIQF